MFGAIDEKEKNIIQHIIDSELVDHKENLVLSKKRHVVKIGSKYIGGDHKILIQTMTSGKRRDQNDLRKTIEDEVSESIELIKNGAEAIRIAVNNDTIVQAIPYIKDELCKIGYADIPIIGCGQYEISRLIDKYPGYLKYLDKLRINPGNIGFGVNRDINFEKVIEFVKKYDKSIRIGGNWGSVNPKMAEKVMDYNINHLNAKFSQHEIIAKLVVFSTLQSAEFARKLGIDKNKVVLSCKCSDFAHMISAYKTLAKYTEYPLHIGLTEAGMGDSAIIKTTSALSVLLHSNIGDTIRVSITPALNEMRSKEVSVAKMILQSMGIRSFSPDVISCPGCGRTSSSRFIRLAQDIKSYVSRNEIIWKSQGKCIENLKIAVMGCIVNGPGESRSANIGFSLPGYGEKGSVAVYVDGKHSITLKDEEGNNIEEKAIGIIDKYIEMMYN